MANEGEPIEGVSADVQTALAPFVEACSNKQQEMTRQHATRRLRKKAMWHPPSAAVEDQSEQQSEELDVDEGTLLDEA